MFNTLKKLWFIAKNFDSIIESEHKYTETRIRTANDSIQQLRSIIADRTDINIDLDYRGKSYVILVGKYHNRDYVETFYVEDSDFGSLVDLIKQFKYTTTINRVDGSPIMKACMMREF